MWADTYCVGNSGRQAKPASYLVVDRGALSSKDYRGHLCLRVEGAGRAIFEAVEDIEEMFQTSGGQIS